jgi:hypothetical protein
MAVEGSAPGGGVVAVGHIAGAAICGTSHQLPGAIPLPPERCPGGRLTLALILSSVRTGNGVGGGLTHVMMRKKEAFQIFFTRALTNAFPEAVWFLNL